MMYIVYIIAVVFIFGFAVITQVKVQVKSKADTTIIDLFAEMDRQIQLKQ